MTAQEYIESPAWTFFQLTEALRSGFHANAARLFQPPETRHGLDSVKAALYDHAECARLIAEATEQDVPRATEINGVMCKSIIDGVTPTTLLRRAVVADVSPEAFANKVCRDHLDLQAALDMNLWPGKELRWLVTENTRPYAAACYGPSYAMYASGLQKLTRALAVIRECQESGNWPGFSGVLPLALPAWREKEMENEPAT